VKVSPAATLTEKVLKLGKGALKRDRVLSDAELKKVWHASMDMGDYGRLVRLLMLTGQRISDWSEARRDEIAGDVLLVPGARFKNANAHLVPLTSEVLKIVDEVPEIEGRDLLLMPGGISDHKIDLDERSGVKDWTHHDLRRSFRTRAVGECDVDPFFAERVMGHALPGLHGVYDQGTHLKQKRAALEAWQAYLLKVVSNPPSKKGKAKLTLVA
jgi:integrase